MSLAGKMKKGDLPAFHMFDVPKAIGDAMGGRQFFFEISAKAVHRIGLFAGLGWLLPVGESRDGIDQIKVVHDKSAGSLTMRFGRCTPANGDLLPEFTLIRQVPGLGYDDLKKTYEEQTGATPR